MIDRTIIVKALRTVTLGAAALVVAQTHPVHKTTVGACVTCVEVNGVAGCGNGTFANCVPVNVGGNPSCAVYGACFE